MTTSIPAVARGPRDTPPPPYEPAGTATPAGPEGPRAAPSLPYDYAAIRRAVLRHVPALEEPIRREEDDYGMHEDGGLAYVLIEDVVWPRLQRAAAEGPAAVRPYGALIAEMIDHGDEQVRTLAFIGLLENVDHRRPVREAIVQAGYASLLDELG